jgi:hypothetical protein
VPAAQPVSASDNAEPVAEESWLLPSEQQPSVPAEEAPAFAAEADDDGELDVPEFLR